MSLTAFCYCTVKTEVLHFTRVVLFIDFQRAFDTTEWDFLMDTLNKFNFGTYVKYWVKIFYNYVTSCHKLVMR